MVDKFSTATEYLANEITINRGSYSDILSVGVYHNIDPNVIPEVGDFTTVISVDGTEDPLPPLAEAGKMDLLSNIGPKVTAHLDLAPDDYQRWGMAQTADEDIIRKLDTVSIL